MFLGLGFVCVCMKDRVNLDLQRALVNVEDGVYAVNSGDSEENIEYFAGEARAAFDGVPGEVPYVGEYRAAIGERDFEGAFEALVNFVSYLEDYDEGQFVFSYQQGEVERVLDSYREFEG